MNPSIRDLLLFLALCSYSPSAPQCFSASTPTILSSEGAVELGHWGLKLRNQGAEIISSQGAGEVEILDSVRITRRGAGELRAEELGAEELGSQELRAEKLSGGGLRLRGGGGKYDEIPMYEPDEKIGEMGVSRKRVDKFRQQVGFKPLAPSKAQQAKAQGEDPLLRGMSSQMMQQVVSEYGGGEMSSIAQHELQAKVEKQIEQNLMKAARDVEEKVDAEIKGLDEMDSDDIEKLREQREKQMRKRAKMEQTWLSNGHGDYREIREPDFFTTCQRSSRVVVHFYRDSTFRCKILDKHLHKLARKHLEARFVSINVEKAPFLVKRLGVKVIPSLKVVLQGDIKSTLIGFEEFGGHDEFKTLELAQALSKHKVIMQPKRGDWEDEEDQVDTTFDLEDYSL